MTNDLWYALPVLTGTKIRLEPLGMEHAPGYLAAVAESREHLTAFALDDVVTGNLRRPRVKVRWVLVHCVSEVAHHCGHLDILREQLLAEYPGH